jgi:hypothetical protein
MTDDPIRVDAIHMVNQLTNADFPIPRPDDTANLKVSKFMRPLFSFM